MSSTVLLCSFASVGSLHRGNDTHCPGTENVENLNGGRGSLSFFLVIFVMKRAGGRWDPTRSSISFSLPTPTCSPFLSSFAPLSSLARCAMTVLPTLTSHQNRVLRLSFFSLGSLVILYILFTLTSSSPTPEAAVLSSPYSSTSGSALGSSLTFPPTPYPVWGAGAGGLMATDKGGINYNAGTGEYRWSEDHPWMKGKVHRRVMVASHFTAHEGECMHV